MSRNIVTKDKIEEILRLKRLGYPDRAVAAKLNVGKTTVWGIYAKSLNKQSPEFRTSTIVVQVVKILKENGHNSLQIAEKTNIPLSEVNAIWVSMLK